MGQTALATRSRRVSSWALKVVMAVTGLIWALFVLIHLFGNLKAFTGPEHFNTYAHWLREAFTPFLPAGAVLWSLRMVLLLALVLHLWAAATLNWRSRRARGTRARTGVRRRLRRGRSSLFALPSLMPVTGLLILAFLLFHLLDLTVGSQPAATSAFVPATGETSSAYQNLVTSLQRPWVAAGYAATMILLSLHLGQGLRSAATDLGATGSRVRLAAAWGAGLVALAILLGNGLLPVAVQLGVVK